MADPPRLFDDQNTRPTPSAATSDARRRFRHYRFRDDGEYAEDEWTAFVRCARRHCDRPDVLHKDAVWKMEERGISDQRLRSSVNAGAKVVAYEHWGDEGKKRFMLWCPDSKCLIIASRNDGLILSVEKMGYERFVQYTRAHQNANLRWIRR